MLEFKPKTVIIIVIIATLLYHYIVTCKFHFQQQCNHPHTTCTHQLPLLVPSLEYNFETRVECLDEVGRTENISVFVMRKGNPAPLISALIKMPVSESVIVV